MISQKRRKASRACWSVPATTRPARLEARQEMEGEDWEEFFITITASLGSLRSQTFTVRPQVRKRFWSVAWLLTALTGSSPGERLEVVRSLSRS